MRADIHDDPEHNRSKQRSDTLMQDRICRIDENLLHRAAGPYIRVKSVVLSIGPPLPVFTKSRRFQSRAGLRMRAISGLMHRSNCALSNQLLSRAHAASFGQPRFAKALNHQRRVRLPAAGDPRRYCKGGIDLKQLRRRLTRLSVTSEMSEGGGETTVRYLIGGVQTLSFLPGDDGLIKATKLNQGRRYPAER